MNHLFHSSSHKLVWGVGLFVCLVGRAGAQEVPSYNTLQEACKGHPTDSWVKKNLAPFVVDGIAAALNDVTAAESDPKRSIAPLMEQTRSIVGKLRSLFPIVAFTLDDKMSLLQAVRRAHSELSRALRILEELPAHASAEQVHATFGLVERCLLGLIGNALDPKSTWSATCAYIEDAKLTENIQKLGRQLPEKIPFLIDWSARSNNREVVKAVLRELRDDFATDIKSYVADLKKVFTARNLAAKQEKFRQADELYSKYSTRMTALFTLQAKNLLTTLQAEELAQTRERMTALAVEKYRLADEVSTAELYKRLAGSAPTYICEEEKSSNPTASCAPPPPENRPAGVTLVHRQTSVPTNAPPVL